MSHRKALNREQGLMLLRSQSHGSGRHFTKAQKLAQIVAKSSQFLVFFLRDAPRCALFQSNHRLSLSAGAGILRAIRRRLRNSKSKVHWRRTADIDRCITLTTSRNRITGPSNAGSAQANVFVHSGELAYDRRLRSDPYDPQRPGVLECGRCEDRPAAPLHSPIA